VPAAQIAHAAASPEVHPVRASVFQTTTPIEFSPATDARHDLVGSTKDLLDLLEINTGQE
jgi:hypothetical protein